MTPDNQRFIALTHLQEQVSERLETSVSIMHMCNVYCKKKTMQVCS